MCVAHDGREALATREWIRLFSFIFGENRSVKTECGTQKGDRETVIKESSLRLGPVLATWVIHPSDSLYMWRAYAAQR